MNPARHAYLNIEVGIGHLMLRDGRIFEGPFRPVDIEHGHLNKALFDKLLHQDIKWCGQNLVVAQFPDVVLDIAVCIVKQDLEGRPDE
jgi:hypothetical protein